MDDIKELFDLADPKYAAMVVKHDYKPKSNTKMDGQIQFPYPRKNWSSLILFNNEHPSHKFLDVNGMTPAELHQFDWIADKDLGELPERWNWLVGYYDDLCLTMIHLHCTTRMVVHGLKKLKTVITLVCGINIMRSV